MNEISQRFIAQALGMSQAAVSKFVRRGMPISSVEAARAWHRTHVRPRMSSNPSRRYATELAAVEGLWPLAQSAMAAGHLDVIRPALGAALRAVPHAARHLVTIERDVADELVKPMLTLLRENSEPGEGLPMTDQEAERMGAFWYAILAEEDDAFRHLELD